MQVDFSSMAKELGLRLDALRILNGNPTRLQRLIRKTSTFEEAASLSSEFRDDSYSTCGPKFEVEERAEYYARREEFFPAYLDQFKTIESFSGLGRRIYSGLTLGEREMAGKRISELVQVEIARLKEAAQEKDLVLALVKLRDSIRATRSDEVSWFEGALGLVRSAIQSAFVWQYYRLMEPRRKVKEAVQLFQSLSDVSREVLGYGYDRSAPWASLWREETSIARLLYIEKNVPGSFIDNREIEARLVDLVSARSSSIEGFAGRMDFAKLFAKRDSQHAADPAYSVALRSAAKVATTGAQVHVVSTTWQDRHKVCSNLYNREALITPAEIPAAYDRVFLTEAKEADDPSILAQIGERAIWGTRTRDLVYEKLHNHFKSSLSQAQTAEEIEEIEQFAKSIGYGGIGALQRVGELKREAHARRIDEIWERVASGETVEDEKRVLIGLFQEFKDKDTERTRKVIRLLAKYFPAESVDEVEVQM